MASGRRSAVAAVLLAAALLVAACGGGPQTKDGFIDDADAVCERLAERFATAGATDPQTPAEVAQSNGLLADLYGELRSDVEGIELPEDAKESAGAQAWVDAVKRTEAPLQRLQVASSALVEAAGGQDARALSEAGNSVRSGLDAFRAASAEADRLAVEYGFNLCGNLG